MFPNNMEFFVEERIAERYAEAEKHRLAQELTGPDAPKLRRKLGKVVYRLGRRMIDWSELLQYSDQLSAADQPEGSTP
jgi:hypothetical protein